MHEQMECYFFCSLIQFSLNPCFASDQGDSYSDKDYTVERTQSRNVMEMMDVTNVCLRLSHTGKSVLLNRLNYS